MTTDVAPAAPPLDQPLYGIGIIAAVARFFRKYATFSGRASRSEYWWVVVAFAVFSVPLSVINVIAASSGASVAPTGGGQPGVLSVLVAVVAALIAIATIVPFLAITVRRLHDANLSGLLCLLHLVPYLGSLLLAAIAARPSNPLGARFDARRG